MKANGQRSIATYASIAVLLLFTNRLWGAFGELVYTVTSDAFPGSRTFGWSVAVDGDIALLGAPGNLFNGNDLGSAVLFDLTTGTRLRKLTPTDVQPGDCFGQAVAISGGRALVAAPRRDHAGAYSGSAFVFDIRTGQQLATLTPDDAAKGDKFGTSVAISGNTAIVGAPGDDGDQPGYDDGSAYLFDTTTGQQVAKLTIADTGGLGLSVAISGNTALAGGPFESRQAGAAYLFDANSGNQIAKFTIPNLDVGAELGWSVGISGKYVLVAAPRTDAHGAGAGSTYLFDRTTGDLLSELIPDDVAAGMWFGESIAINGSRALIGSACDADVQCVPSAYLFDLTSGEQLAKFTATGALTGSAVALSQKWALLGTRLENDKGLFGTVYVYSVVPEPSMSTLAVTVAVAFALRQRARWNNVVQAKRPGRSESVCRRQ
jgi:hypothetical protein